MNIIPVKENALILPFILYFKPALKVNIKDKMNPQLINKNYNTEMKA